MMMMMILVSSSFPYQQIIRQQVVLNEECVVRVCFLSCWLFAKKTGLLKPKFFFSFPLFLLLDSQREKSDLKKGEKGENTHLITSSSLLFEREKERERERKRERESVERESVCVERERERAFCDRTPVLIEREKNNVF